MTKNTNKEDGNQQPTKKKTTIMSIKNLEFELDKHFDFRYNTISNKVEGKLKKNKNYKPINENSVYRHLHIKGTPIGMSKLKIILGSDFIKEYNPIKSYFHQTQLLYNETKHGDYIDKLLRHCQVPDHDLFVRTFKAWMVSALQTIFNDKSVNKRIFVLFNNIQNSGKTTFARSLFPDDIKVYVLENQLDDNKDGLITLSKCAFHILDEMEVLERMRMSSFKSVISKDKIDLRPPYGTGLISKPRITSFIGTSDRFGFLKEDVGTARFIVQEVKKIDFNYSKKINPDILWSQAYQLYKNNEFLTISNDDQKAILENNKRFIRTSFISEAILELLKPSTKDEGEFMMSSEIAKFLKSKNQYIQITDRKIGDSLNSLGFERVKYYSKERKLTLSGYFVELSTLESE